MKKCKVCDKNADAEFNINFKAVPICEQCANQIALQQINWLIDKNREKYTGQTND